MLTALSVRDIVLIDALDLDLKAGLSALTGETGAGKSILLAALGLACGDRAERAQVRAGAGQASASAAFEPGEGHPVWAILEEAGLPAERGEAVLLRRTVSADGRSKAYVNDQPASVGLLRRLGDVLVEIHGQHDGRGLLDPKSHRGLLDAFARNAAERDLCRSAYEAMSDARRDVDTLREAQLRAGEDEAFLRHAVEELEALAPEPGEEAALADERRFLQQAERALEDIDAASALVAGGEGLETRLNTALRGLERVGALLGEGETGEAAAAARAALERATGAMDRALIEFAEAGDALRDAAAAFDAEPGRLEAVEERLFALRAAARKHNTSADELSALRDRLAAELERIDRSGDRLAEAEARLERARADYRRAAAALTDSRVQAGEALAKAVAAELPPLKLEKARFRVSVTPDEARESREGVDQVAFEVATNPGSPFGAIDRIASGGELSRFSLALKVSLAAGDPGVVMVFDEVDQGVGGAVAEAVGRRLSRLAADGQALVVTHSPQVAARARHHFRIEKDASGEAARTRVRPLDEAERREEIARMLSGADITDAARAAAAELMAS